MSVEQGDGDGGTPVRPARRCTMPGCDREATTPSSPGSLCVPHRRALNRNPDGEAPLLDSHCESRTPGDKRDSGRVPEDEDSADSDDRQNWNRQQKRTFHRVHTLLSYWEQHDYQIRWVTLTSSPESDDADRLAYNLRRLRQTIERASLAKDADGEGHRMDHIRELESLVIRTSEGPEGKGVLHLFWAWKPPSGHHSRDFYIPHHWLKHQWGRIHGPVGEHDDGEVEPLHVWIERVGEAEYHSRESLAGYCVSQYLGEHGEALENVSWSWERSLGGSVTNAWEAVRSMTESLEEAKDVWHRVLGGEEVSLSSTSDYVDYGKVVKPPPNLGVSVSRGVTVTPPEDYAPAGPHRTTIRRSRPSMPEHDPDDGRECPECGSAAGVHVLGDEHPARVEDETGRTAMRCAACKQRFARPGEGEAVAPDREIAPRWTTRQTRLAEFEAGGPLAPGRENVEPVARRGGPAATPVADD